MNKAGAKKPYVAIVCSVVGLATAAFWHSGRLHAAPGIADLKKNTVVPANGQPEAVAISMDGTAVAMMHRDFNNQVTTGVLEVRDVQSGRELGTLSLPPIQWGQGRTQYYVWPRLKYCDAGKYLLVFDGPDTLHVVDARRLQIHASIAVGDLRLRRGREVAGQRFADTNLLSDVAMDCSANSGVAALGAWADLGVVSLKLFDLDKGTETADLSGIFNGRYERYTGDGLAISPDGSKLALGTWRFIRGGGSTVEVVDTRTKAFLKTLPLGDRTGREHQLAFAGEGALVIGEPVCQPNHGCDQQELPHERTLRVWDFGGTGTVRTLGWPGAEVYRNLGASATGDVVFGYTGAESYCKSCRNGFGETKIDEARFTVWNRRSGQAVARSPKLEADRAPCMLVQIGASCDEDERVPELQMSANGKAVLAFWTGRFPPRDDGAEASKLEVYRLP